MVNTTSSEELVQLPLDMVHRNVTVLPATSPVTAEAGSAGLTMVAVPDTTFQTPLPVTGVFPAKVVDVPHTVWSAPAFAVVGVA